MIQSSALSALVIIALSLSVWAWVHFSGLRSLDASETTVVVGFFTAAVLVIRWLLARRRRRLGRNRLPVVVWWGTGAAMAATQLLGLPLVAAHATAAESDLGAATAEIACGSDQPTVRSGEVMTLTAWRLPALATGRRYEWTVTAGTVAPGGNTARWSFDGVPAGSHRAVVRVTETSRRPIECTVNVIVRDTDDVLRAGPEGGGAFLPSGQNEAPDYGLYSYLLLGAAPDDATHDRYLRTLDSYLRKVPHITRLEQYLPVDQLNVVYVPVIVSPTNEVRARWLLDHYDFARARFLLRRLPGSLRQGPYFVSSLQPLGNAAQTPREYLFQDLSTVPQHLIDSWVIAFLNQSAQERFWKPSTVEALNLRMRTLIGVLAVGLPDVRRSLKDWVDVRK
jgi:hypothetical protein